MGREVTVLRALERTSVPVPRVIAACPDAGVIGAPFYVMQYVDGLILRSRPDVGRCGGTGERRGVADAMMDTLARLHEVDPSAVGLEGFGHPLGFLGRQVRRWGQQLDRSRSRHVPGLDTLRVRLAGSVPADAASQARAGIVHGDYRLDNLVLDPATLDVAAVLDWEMSTLGDPLADLGLLLAYWDGLGSIPNPIADGVGPRSGFPLGQELVDRYARTRGLGEADLRALPWCTAFGYFKVAVILEGIHYRFTKGKTTGAGFDRIGELVPLLVDGGLEALP
jgi:aminoglycoside phosphotransferase (APT) family kinase protein